MLTIPKPLRSECPLGRGTKPNQPPRKRKKAKHPTTDDLVIIPRITDEQHTNVNMPQNSKLQYKTVGPNFSVSQPMPNCQNVDRCFVRCQNVDRCFVRASLPPELYQQNFQHRQLPPAVTTPRPSTYLSPTPYDQLVPPQFRPPYPAPRPNSFIIYLIGFCSPQTSVCFGCGSSLKPGGLIGNPPADLVIVSNMHREWRKDGDIRCKSANVYFHCILTCVRNKQPFFQPDQCTIPQQIQHFLTQEHILYIGQSFANMTIS